MTKVTQCAAPPAGAAATPSIFGMLFEQKQVSENPQVDEDQVAIQKHSAEHQAIKEPSVLADLHLLQQLTRQLQLATMGTTSNNYDEDLAKSKSLIDEKNSLASLYCRRAAALLAFVDYDATVSVPLDILALEPSTGTLSEETNQSAPMLEGVRQALHDAQAAVALTSDKATLAEAHLLCAYCSRSLGELSHAQTFTALAATASPDNETITSLVHQLDVEAHVDGTDLVPKLRMTSATVSTLAINNAEAVTNLHYEDGDNNDQTEHVVTELPIPVDQHSFWGQVALQYQVLEEAAYSTWLEKLERLLHQNVHHRCSHPNETRKLDRALQATFALLALLLQSQAACLAFNLDVMVDEAARTVEKLTQAAASSTEIFVQNRTARKWIVQVWAPAVRRAILSTDQSPFIDISCDVLVMLSRLLQVSSNLRQCTSMAYGLAYAEMGYDLAKVYSTVGDQWTRLKMQGAEAYASALLQRATDLEKALMTFQETLQAALKAGDHEYEVRSRFHVVKTLRLLGKVEDAFAELVLLLERCRTINDVCMEAIAEFEMGQHFAQQDDMDKALEHFRRAQALCNRTANCADSWRALSIQQAIIFYARLRPTVRRGAIRYSMSASRLPVNNEKVNDVKVNNEAEAKDQREDGRPQERRRAIWYKDVSSQPQSLMSALIKKSSSNSLFGPKPKRTMSWRETVFATSDSNLEAE